MIHARVVVAKNINSAMGRFRYNLVIFGLPKIFTWIFAHSLIIRY